MDKERVLEILRASEVLMEGHFLLTSGRHSNRYMQCARILQYPEYTEEICEEMANLFRDENIDVVIGPATGGIIPAYEVARMLKARNLFTERENGKMVLRRGFYLPAGSRVLVIEDVITTGGTVQEVVDLATALGGQVVGVAVIVDRSMGVVSFGVPHKAVYTVDQPMPCAKSGMMRHDKANMVSWSPEECPLCREGKIPAVKPGSRPQPMGGES